jgi:hypothetical protein
MPTNFLSLPGEIRNKIYSYILLSEGVITLGPKQFYDDEPDQKSSFARHWMSIGPFLWQPIPELNILQVSKAINKETKSFFYSQNLINLALHDSSRVSQIFDQIGPESTSQLEHVLIHFPHTSGTSGQNLPFRTVDIAFEIFKLVRKHCTNLKKITTFVYRSPNVLPHFLSHQSGDAIRETMVEIDGLFRSIPSPREIVAKVWRCNHVIIWFVYPNTSEFMEREMERLGWRVEDLELECKWPER